MKNIFWISLFLFCLSACGHSQYWNTICTAENYIEEKPDSVLSVLQGIDDDALSGKEEKAKYSLLLSMALDKNYIDKTDFELLQPAIDWYGKHGNATEKLRTCYYQGRIHENKGDNTAAMLCFLDALDKGKDSQEILTKARVLSSLGGIYLSLFDIDKYIEVKLTASELFKRAGKEISMINCLISVINGYTINKDASCAQKYIDICEELLPSMDESQKSYYYSTYLTYIVYNGTSDSIERFLDDLYQPYKNANVDWLSISNAYMKIGRNIDALSAARNYILGSDIRSDVKYYLLSAHLYESIGHYKEALGAYTQYISASDSLDLIMYKQNTRTIEEKYNLEMRNVKEKESKKIIYFWSLIGVIIIIGIIVWIMFKLRLNKSEKEKYRLLYLHMEQERDELKDMMENGSVVSDSIKTALSERINLLNTFFAASITDNSDINHKAYNAIDQLLADRHNFMSSTRLSFVGSNPKFIKYLEMHDLTESEIDYCCLYALGLRGKEVGSYIKMKSHYNISSAIRVKLGITEHDTNLGIFIRKLLQEL